MRWPITARCKQIAADTSGAEVAEFAAVLPILVMILLGIMSFARAYNVYTTITYAAQEGARAAAVSTCATCSPPGPTDAANNAASRVTQVLQASKIDPTAIQTYAGTQNGTACGGGAPSCSTTANNVTVCTNVELDTGRTRRGRTTLTGPASCGASVSFQYPYQMNVPFTSIGTNVVTLHADVEIPSED